MRSRQTSILALLAITMIAAAPTSGPVVGAGSGFQMQLPPGFSPRHTKPPATGPASVSVLLLATTVRSPAAKNIQVLQVQRMTSESGNPFTERDLKSFATGAAKDSAAAMQSDETPDLVATTLGDEKAYRYSLTGKRGKNLIREMTTVAIHGGTAWYVQYLADPADFTANLGGMQAALESFRWTDAKKTKDSGSN